jgi:1,4-dihydroxy-2-naphthoyl-CoA hydrolase
MSDVPSSRRTPERFNSAGAGKLPGHLGIVITEVSDLRVAGELPVVESVMAPNGYLHAGTIVTLADTVAGYGCIANLPEEATGFTTIELKSNHLGTAREGTIVGVATPVHRGKTTQVWDAVVVHRESGRTLAVFRCTQMILYTKQKTAAELP